VRRRRRKLRSRQRPTAGRHHRGAHHLDRRQHHRRQGRHPGDRPGGHQLPHVRAPPERREPSWPKADVIFINGLVLEEPTKELAEQNKPDGTEIVELGGLTITPEEYIFDFSFPEEEGKPNPHLWTNPPMAKTYAEIIAEKMTELDPDNGAYYAENLAKFAAEIDKLDAAMRTAFETVPPAQRQLLTYHDAYAYFAKDYGWTVVGAIQVSDFEDPTPQEVGNLIQQVRDAEAARHLRLRGLPLPGPRTDRQGDRRRVLRRPARRRPPRRLR
jgi:ABC-type Zn uptake system ZnuABC Zn-binding protein ZnuA